MRLIASIATAGAFANLVWASLAYAQFPTPERERKKRPRYEEKALMREGEDAESGEPSAFFPDWSPPNFDWMFQPMIGAQAESYDSGVTKRTSALTELGLGLGLSGIPVVYGNPGFYLKPHVGYGAGTLNEKVKVQGQDEVTNNATFTRLWYGNDFVLFLNFYRHTLGLQKADLQYKGDRTDSLYSLAVKNDFAVLVLPWLSTHLTINQLTAYESSMSKPTLTERDHWLHARMAFDFLSTYLDFGPGFTNLEAFGEDATGNRVTLGKGQTNYLKALYGFHLFWKLGLTGRLNYIYDGPNFAQAATDLVSNERLPTQNVGAPSVLMTLPDDSLESYSFLGLRDLFAGIGVGYVYRVTILNYSEKNGRERETFAEQGLAASYEANF